MKWLELTVYTTDAGIDAVCAALNGAGITGLSIEESHEKAFAFLQEAALFWDFAVRDKIGTDTPCVKGYVADCPENLPTVEAAKQAVERLKTLDLPVDLGPLLTTVVSVDEEDWANNWKKYYKPLEIGSRLLVLPSWEELPETDRTVLKLDPGMAFGTGAHHTTRMCLEFLEQIAARLLGAVDAKAVDIDPIAESIAYENAAMNGIDREHYRVLIGNVLSDTRLQKKIAGQYPVVAANIVADVIIALAPLARTLVAPGGVFLVSGIIDERADEVVKALQNSGFAVAEHKNAEGWNAFLCR